MCNLARLVRDTNGQPSSSPIITGGLVYDESATKTFNDLARRRDVRDYQKYEKTSPERFNVLVRRDINARTKRSQ